MFHVTCVINHERSLLRLEEDENGEKNSGFAPRFAYNDDLRIFETCLSVKCGQFEWERTAVE